MILALAASALGILLGTGLLRVDQVWAAEAPPLKGHFADSFILSDPPAPAPGVAMVGGDGTEVALGDLAGKVVLVNFWATWCAPCVREMPALDRLQAALGPEGLLVVPISRDRGGRNTVEPFYQKHELAELGIYLDPEGTVTKAFKVRGLPTSVLIDRQGLVVGELRGDAEWDSEDAKALIRHYLTKPGSES